MQSHEEKYFEVGLPYIVATAQQLQKRRSADQSFQVMRRFTISGDAEQHSQGRFHDATTWKSGAGCPGTKGVPRQGPSNRYASRT